MKYREHIFNTIVITTLYFAASATTFTQNGSKNIEILVLSKTKELKFGSEVNQRGFNVIFLETLDSVSSVLNFLSERDPEGLVVLVKSELIYVLDNSWEIHKKFKQRNTSILVASSALIGYASPINALISETNIFGSHSDYTKSETLHSLPGIKFDSSSNIFQTIDSHLRATIGSCQNLKFWKLEPQNFRIGQLDLMVSSNGSAKIYNTVHKSWPTILVTVETDTGTRSAINFFGNYLAGCWDTKQNICQSCENPNMNLRDRKSDATQQHDSTQSRASIDFSTVLLGIFITRPVPFLNRFLKKISHLNYPKNKIHVALYCSSSYQENLVNIAKFSSKFNSSYASFTSYKRPIKSYVARQMSLETALLKNVSYYFHLDAEAHLDNPDTLQVLLDQFIPKIAVISPLLSIPYRTSSNFWGEIDSAGSNFGKKMKSRNYLAVVRREHRGYWNVPCISSAYLVDMAHIKNRAISINYTKRNDGVYCLQYNDEVTKGQWPFIVTNLKDLGHKVTGNFFGTEERFPELHQLPFNRFDWELSYLHPEYPRALPTNSAFLAHQPRALPIPDSLGDCQTTSTKYSENFRLNGNSKSENCYTIPSKAENCGAKVIQGTNVEEPCQDVFWFPLVTEHFCKELIQIAELSGEWSEGTNYQQKENESEHPNPDPFPTVDVDLEDFDYAGIWLKIVQLYITPLRKLVFGGFILNPPFIETTIVIRYRPEEQSSNKPHHDSSTYTVNLALNEPHRDFEGGGCHFIPQNCSVTESRVGWILMHPGDLTHYHEGLSTTSGTRYILVSFIDPRMKDKQNHPLRSIFKT